MSGQPRLSPLDCTCFRIRGAARRVSQIYSKHLASTGLKISQFSLLGFVTAEGPVSIGRLSDLLATDRTTLTRNLRPLLQGGLIERARPTHVPVGASGASGERPDPGATGERLSR